MIYRLLLALYLATAAAWTTPYAPKVEVSMLSGWQNPDGTRTIAIQIELERGWKTYWRAPGDAGIPPQINWSASRNLASAALHWPRPVVFDQSGMRSIGYKRQLILPVTLTPKRAGKPITAKATLDIGVCKDICVPVRLKITEAHAKGRGERAIKAALATVPQTPAKAGISAITCSVSPGPEGLALTVRLKSPQLGSREDAAIETGDPLIWAREPTLHRSGNTLTLQTELIHALGTAFALNRSALRITLLGSERAVDIQGCG